MKVSKPCLLVALIPIAALLSACSSSSGDSVSQHQIQTDPFFPHSPDNHEGLVGDNTPETASSISIGEQQRRTLWPVGDVDYVKVELLAGTEYEFSANELCVTCDTFMTLYDTDGVTELDSNDDYIGLDSRIRFLPMVDGTYYLKIEAYKDNLKKEGQEEQHVEQHEEPYADLGVAIYTLSAHEFIDNDGDGYSTYYDCDDTDSAVYPRATEIPEDGISQNCSGVDGLAATTPDQFEPDNDPANAQPLFMADVGLWEIQFQQAAWEQNMRTLHAPGDIDYFTFTLGPQEGAYLNMHGVAWPHVDLELTLYDSDGTTQLAERVGHWPSLWVANTTKADKTFYASYQAADGESTTWYVPALYSAGVDKDGDGYYTRDWPAWRDCNDNNPKIHPGATEIPGDGIDSNCDGHDNPL